jgi:hypothetical protein
MSVMPSAVMGRDRDEVGRKRGMALGPKPEKLLELSETHEIAKKEQEKQKQKQRNILRKLELDVEVEQELVLDKLALEHDVTGTLSDIELVLEKLALEHDVAETLFVILVFSSLSWNLSVLLISMDIGDFAVVQVTILVEVTLSRGVSGGGRCHERDDVELDDDEVEIGIERDTATGTLPETETEGETSAELGEDRDDAVINDESMMMTSYKKKTTSKKKEQKMMMTS